MQIEPNREPMRVNTSPSEPAKKTAETKVHDEFISTIANLKAELIQSQESVRPEVIQRGRELLQTESYPSEETVASIADLLGNQIETTV